MRYPNKQIYWYMKRYCYNLLEGILSSINWKTHTHKSCNEYGKHLLRCLILTVKFSPSNNPV